MKNAIALLLALLMVLSLAACGSQTDSVGKIDEDKQQTEQADQIDNSQQSETGATEETQQSETSVQEENIIYTLDTVPKPNGRENPTEVTEDGYVFVWQNQTERQELDDYIVLLTAEGFAVSEFSAHKSDDKIQVAQATRGNATVELSFSQGEMFEKIYYDFYVLITVEEVELSDVNADLSRDEFDSLIPALPEVKWYDNDGESAKARWKHHQTSQLDMDDIAEYVNSLKDSGYTIDMEEAPNGNEDYDVYYFSAKNQDGVEVEVKVSAPENGVLATTISVGVKK